MATSPTPSSCSTSSLLSSSALSTTSSTSSCESLRSMYSYQTIQSDPRGQFCQILENLGPDQESRFHNTSKKCEKMRLILDFLQPITLLPKYIAKDAIAAEHLRIEGNALLKKRLLPDALKRYTMSVLKAPHNSPLLNLALANRSAITFMMGQYEEALKDANLALALGYPSEFRAKLYTRMAKCYLQLRRGQMAKAIAQIALGLIRASGGDEVEALELLDKCDAIIDEANNDDNKKNIDKKNERNERNDENGEEETKNCWLPSLRLEQKSDARGRYVVANRRLDAGQVVWQEKSIAGVLYPSRHYSHCQNCLKRVKFASVPCKMCAGIVFCSLDCRDEAKFHDIECGCIEVLTGLGCSQVARLAFRLVAKNSLLFLKNLYKRHLGSLCNEYYEENQKERGENGKKESSTIKESVRKDDFDATRTAFSKKCLDAETEYVQLMHLVDHDSSRSPKDIWQRSVMAGILVKLLMHTEHYFTSTEEDKVLIGLHLLKLMQILQFNAHECYEVLRKSSKSLRPFQNMSVALVIYGSSSYFNHSCHGTVARFFDGHNISLITLRPVASHEELSDNYGPTFYFSDLESRRRELKLRYWFHCQCLACRENWPLLRQLGNISKNFDKMNKILSEAIEQMDKANLKGAMQLLCNAAQTFYLGNGQQYCRPSELLVRIEDKMRSCVANMGNVHIVDDANNNVANNNMGNNKMGNNNKR